MTHQCSQFRKEPFGIDTVLLHRSVVTSKYRKRMQAEERASGIDTEQSELDVLLEELIERENLAEEEGNEFKRKVEEDKCKALDIRKTAMENLAQTKKRKVSEDGKETKKKQDQAPKLSSTSERKVNRS